MKVTEFFLGFGPRIWSFRRGETEYGVKAIPAGAYVKIIGMHNLDEFDPADEDRTYMSKPYWRRLSVAVAGSAMHFLLAIVAALRHVRVRRCPRWRLPRRGLGRGRPRGRRPESPAGRAGVQGGDEIVVRSTASPTSSFDDFREVVAARPGETVAVSIVARRRAHDVRADAGRAQPRLPRSRVGYFGVGPDDPPSRPSGR